MAFCQKCGAAFADGIFFCPQCGAKLNPAATAPAAGMATPATTHAASSGLRENVASMLCYSVGWITGIIFLLIDRRPVVRFHAAQSFVIFGLLFLARLVVTYGILAPGSYAFFSLWPLLSLLLGLVTLGAWVGLMVMAYRGKRVEVPIAARLAKRVAGSGVM